MMGSICAEQRRQPPEPMRRKEAARKSTISKTGGRSGHLRVMGRILRPQPPSRHPGQHRLASGGEETHGSRACFGQLAAKRHPPGKRCSRKRARDQPGGSQPRECPSDDQDFRYICQGACQVTAAESHEAGHEDPPRGKERIQLSKDRLEGARRQPTRTQLAPASRERDWKTC